MSNLGLISYTDNIGFQFFTIFDVHVITVVRLPVLSKGCNLHFLQLFIGSVFGTALVNGLMKSVLGLRKLHLAVDYVVGFDQDFFVLDQLIENIMHSLNSITLGLYEVFFLLDFILNVFKNIPHGLNQNLKRFKFIPFSASCNMSARLTLDPPSIMALLTLLCTA